LNGLLDISIGHTICANLFNSLVAVIHLPLSKKA
jgi:hypothetical protein